MSVCMTVHLSLKSSGSGSRAPQLIAGAGSYEAPQNDCLRWIAFDLNA